MVVVLRGCVCRGVSLTAVAKLWVFPVLLCGAVELCGEVPLNADAVQS